MLFLFIIAVAIVVAAVVVAIVVAIVAVAIVVHRRCYCCCLFGSRLLQSETEPLGMLSWHWLVGSRY